MTGSPPAVLTILARPSAIGLTKLARSSARMATRTGEFGAPTRLFWFAIFRAPGCGAGPRTGEHGAAGTIAVPRRFWGRSGQKPVKERDQRQRRSAAAWRGIRSGEKPAVRPVGCEAAT